MTAAEVTYGLDEASRTRLGRFADALISGSPGWPSASVADVHTVWIERTFAARPDMLETVKTVLAIKGEPDAVLAELRAGDPVRFETFVTAIAGSYLMNPRVRRQFGLPSGPPERNPPFPDEADFYLDGGILDPVIARGSAGFRRTRQSR